MKLRTLMLPCLCMAYNCVAWGFLCHHHINRQAVFCLPPELFGFYRAHIVSLTEKAVNPDKRRYILDNEAPKHFIDLDYYKDSAFIASQPSWKEALLKYPADTLTKHGILPWNLVRLRKQLTDAFLEKNTEKIIKLSADVGHYLGDANVPLHTTQNYNGQLTGQVGIHALWESRIPELYLEEFSYWGIRCKYITNWHKEIWTTVLTAHTKVDSVLHIEKELTQNYDEAQKYAIETKGKNNVKTYSKAFTKAYHERLNHMVEKQMRRSIQSVADFWYSCWIDAGQPMLTPATPQEISIWELEKVELKDSSNHIHDHKNCEGLH